MIKRKTLRSGILVLFGLFFSGIVGIWIYSAYFTEIETSEIDKYYGFLAGEGKESSYLILDLGIKGGSDLQLAVNRIKRSMALVDYDIALSFHGKQVPPAYIERKGPFLTIYFSNHIKRLREKINILVHEIGHVYVWGLKDVPENYDEEKVVDVSGVFLGLGIPVLNGFTDITSISNTGEYLNEKKFYGYLTPGQFGYLLARYCDQHNIYPGNVELFLNSSGKKYFSRGCDHLERYGRSFDRGQESKPGAFWCPECGTFNLVDISKKIDSINCDKCGWEKKWPSGNQSWFTIRRNITRFLHGPFRDKLESVKRSLLAAEIDMLFFFNRKLSNAVCDRASNFFIKIPGRGLIILFSLLLLSSRRRYHKDTALLLLSSYAVAQCVYLALKYAVARPRPFVEMEYVRLVCGTCDGYSFPSGHAAISFCLAEVISIRYPPMRFLAFLTAFLAGVLRVYLGAHYPGDILAGALLGIAVGWAMVAVGGSGSWIKNYGKKQRKKRSN